MTDLDVDGLGDRRDAARVVEWLSAGRLCHGLGGPNLVHLSRALGAICGVERRNDHVDDVRWTDELRREIGSPMHLAVILLDGLGINALEEHLQPDDFLRRHIRREMRSVFPATTTASLTSLMSSEYPSTHGLIGWTVTARGPDSRVVCADPLPFVEHGTQKSLHELQIAPKELFTRSSSPVLAQMRRRTRHISSYCESEFARHVMAAKEQTFCEDLAQSLDALEQYQRVTDEPTFAYVYDIQPDRTEHATGFTSRETHDAICSLNAQVERLWRRTEDIAGGRTLIVVADHGHVESPSEDNLVLDPQTDAAIAEHLLCPPTTEPRSPCFHVRKGSHKAFAEAFRSSRFGESFALLRAEDAEKLKLFGRGLLSEVARERMGDFVAITPTDKVILYKGAKERRGMHGGMTPQEMRIPLIILN